MGALRDTFRVVRDPSSRPPEASAGLLDQPILITAQVASRGVVARTGHVSPELVGTILAGLDVVLGREDRADER